MKKSKLLKAVEKQDVKKIEKLLISGENPNEIYKECPIIFDTLEHPNILKLFIEYKADINARIPNKHYTPLIFCIKRNWEESALILIENNADPLLFSFAGMNAIEYATELRKSVVLKELLKKQKKKKNLKESLDIVQRKQLNKKNIKLIEKRILEL